MWLGTPKDGDIPLTAPQKPADYYAVLLGTQQEPDGSPHIIAQSVEFQVLQCLPGEQGCAPAGTDTRWFYDTDAIGSVRLITDDGGGTFARYDYAPFGEPTLAENPDNQRRFAGKELDAETGLNYFGARYFAAELGRFTTVDPGAADGDLLNPQSWNAYAYSRNNPLRFVDPAGACSQDAAGNYTDSDDESSTFVSAGECLKSGGALFTGVSTSVTASPASQLALLSYQIGSNASALLKSSLIEMGRFSAMGATGGLAEAWFATGSVIEGSFAIEGSSVVTNPVPGTIARVVPGGISATTLGRRGASDVFVTAADDIAGMNAAQLAKRLGIPKSPSGFQVIEFPTPRSGLASPVFRDDPGFVGRGLTRGGAREFVIPNGPIPADAVLRMVQ